MSPPVGPPFTPPGHTGNPVDSFFGEEEAAMRVGAAFIIFMGLATTGSARSAAAELTPAEHKRGRHLERRR